MKTYRKSTPVLDREFSSNDAFLSELGLRATRGGGSVASWLN